MSAHQSSSGRPVAFDEDEVRRGLDYAPKGVVGEIDLARGRDR